MLMCNVHPLQLFHFEQQQISAVAPKTLTDQHYTSIMNFVEHSTFEREKTSPALIVINAKALRINLGPFRRLSLINWEDDRKGFLEGQDHGLQLEIARAVGFLDSDLPRLQLYDSLRVLFSLLAFHQDIVFCALPAGVVSDLQSYFFLFE